MSSLSLVVAANKNWGIGVDGGIPWRLPGDMAYFKQVTTEASEGNTNAVVMGRRTWESIPAKFRPLPNRVNIVLTRTPGSEFAQSLPDSVHCASSLDGALKLVQAIPKLKKTVETIYVIGGAQLYAEAVKHPALTSVHLTTVEADVECDTFIPDMTNVTGLTLESSSAVQEEKGIKYRFQQYSMAAGQQAATAAETTPTKTKMMAGDAVFTPVQEPETKQMAGGAGSVPAGLREPHEEYQYLDLVREVIENGVTRGDRTGTGTRALFGKRMQFDLRTTFPLLTTKRVFWRGVAEELLWFVKGSTNGHELAEKGIKIWDGNGSREYLDSIGLTDRAEGDLGPVYGFQWRHFGAAYVDRDADYTGQGVDQLAEVIDKIKNNPNDRRIIMTAWNPAALKEMALPPCHMFCQFFVADGEVSCLMYQRSCDLGLGVPFNIASYALLTRLVAQVCGLKAGDFIHICGDTHVYSNHVEPLQEQITRTPGAFPTLNINPDITDIDGFTFADFELVGYKPQATIKMQMAV